MKETVSASWITRAFPVLSRAFSWRTARALCLALAGAGTLVALCYSVENWRGQREWERFAAELQARGERLDLEAFLPPPVPDELNFAAAPVLKPLFENHPTPLRSPDSGGGDGLRAASDRARLAGAGAYGVMGPGWGLWPRGLRVDLTAWQAYFRGSNQVANAEREAGLTEQRIRLLRRTQALNPRPEVSITPAPQTPAEDVRLALSHFDAAISELRTASDRPRARALVRYQDWPPPAEPHLWVWMNLAGALGLRASAELALGDAPAAEADILLGFRLAEVLRSEPLYSAHAIRLRSLMAAAQGIWEGWVDNRWSAAQWTRFQAALEPLDLFSDFDRVVGGERASDNLAIDLAIAGRLPLAVLRKRLGFPEAADEEDHWQTLLAYGPRGWLYQNKVAYNQRVRSRIEALHQLAKTGSCPGGIVAASEDGRGEPAGLSTYVAGMLAQRLCHIARSSGTARAQAYLRLALTVCALERYRQARGRYPQDLAELTPDYLKTPPLDVVSGAPLAYHPTKEGRFVLYSVGPNGIDEEGENPWHLIHGEIWPGSAGPDDWTWIDPVAR